MTTDLKKEEKIKSVIIVLDLATMSFIFFIAADMAAF